jgi:predicted AAA+ superfamily ATPase
MIYKFDSTRGSLELSKEGTGKDALLKVNVVSSGEKIILLNMNNINDLRDVLYQIKRKWEKELGFVDPDLAFKVNQADNEPRPGTI